MGFKLSSAHTDRFIRLWMRTVGKFEVVVAGNEGGAFLLPSPFVCSWGRRMSLFCACDQLVWSSPPGCFLLHIKFLHFSILKYCSLSFVVLCFTSSCALTLASCLFCFLFLHQLCKPNSPSKYFYLTSCLQKLDAFSRQTNPRQNCPSPCTYAAAHLTLIHFKRRVLVGEDGVRGGKSLLADTHGRSSILTLP